MTVNTFEQGPIRPPSEAGSLLVRVSRNCPWNHCAFCHTYKQKKFELRTVEEVKRDIDAMSEIAEDVKKLSVAQGEDGRISEKTLKAVFDQYPLYNEYYRSIALWLYYGGRFVFLQDANSLVMKTDDIVSILNYIREKFSSVNRITTYCRSKTAARKSLSDLKRIRDAGLSRIHVGMESGSDTVLKYIRKGVTAADHIEGGKKIRAAGISLCGYIMPGLGGRLYTKEHATETARVINAINPDFVRMRSLHVIDGTPLMEMMQNGEFTTLNEDGVVLEIREFISRLDGIETTIVSDHILNLLEEIEGKLPEDKGKMLAVLDRYLALSEEQRLVFILGRRRGIYRKLDDLTEKNVYDELKKIVEHYRGMGNGAFEKHLSMLKSRYI